MIQQASLCGAHRADASELREKAPPPPPPLPLLPFPRIRRQGGGGGGGEKLPSPSVMHEWDGVTWGEVERDKRPQKPGGIPRLINPRSPLGGS